MPRGYAPAVRSARYVRCRHVSSHVVPCHNLSPDGSPLVSSFPVHDLRVVLTLAAAMLLVSACGQDGSGAIPGGSASGASQTPAVIPPELFHAPLECPTGTDVLILQRVPIMLGHPATIVVARCDSGAGSPPSGVFVVDGAAAAAKVTATLVRPGAQVEISSVTVNADHLHATGMGYSSPDVPRCCPDRTVTLVWRIDGSHLVAAG